MSFAIRTKMPGQIIIRESTPGNFYIHYKTYKSKRRVSSGLVYNKKNIKVVEHILEHHFKLYLEKSDNAVFEKEEIEINDIQQSFYYFKQALQQKNISSRTVYEYENSFNKIILGEYPCSQKVKVYKNGKYENIYNFEYELLNFIKSTENSGNTINKHIRHLQVFIRFLISRNELEHINLYEKYRLNTTQKIVEPYSPEEALAIIEKAKEQDEYLHLLLMLFYLTGARLSELLKAYFNRSPYNVDLEKRIITFRNKIKKHQSQTIPISDKLYEILSTLKKLSENRVNYTDKVIPYSENSQSTIIRKINRIENELGIKKKGRSTHGFRRLLATELFAKEIPIDIIKDIMRHSSIETTLKSYRAIDVNRIKDSLDKLNR